MIPMSTQSSRETREGEQDSIDTRCTTSLTGRDTGWMERPADAFPPGYPALCTDPCCFGEIVPDDAWQERGTADFDHTEVTDTLVCSTQNGTNRRYHLPEGLDLEVER